MLDKNKIIGIVVGMFACGASFAQQGVVISSIGNFAGTTSSISAIQFKSISTCIDVQSGMAGSTPFNPIASMVVNVRMS